MSNRSQHQLLTVSLFAGGVLWGVSSLFGNGSEPGVIERTTSSIVAHANSSSDAAGTRDKEPYQLADAQTYPGKPHRPNPWAKDSDFVDLPSPPGSAAPEVPFQAAVPSKDEDPAGALPPIDGVVIYK